MKNLSILNKKVIKRGKFNYNIAIDIRFDKIYIAISENKGSFYELVETLELTIPQELRKQESEFIHWLKDALSPYKKKYPKAFFWFLISSKHVESFVLHAPVAAKKKLQDLINLTLKNEHNINPDEYVIDYYIICEKLVKNVKKLELFVCAAKKNELQKLKNLAKELGVHPIGVTSYDLALSNLFVNRQGSVAHVFLGTDWSRIDIYRDGYLILRRDIKTGFVSIAEEFLDKIKGNEEEIPFNNIEETQKELSIDEVKEIIVKLDGPEGEDVLNNILSSTIQRFILQLRRTIDFYEREVGLDPVTELYFSGIIDTPDILLNRIYNSLGLTASKLLPITSGLVVHSQNIKSFNAFKEMEFAPVIGCSVCPSARFNFLYTSKDRAKKKLRNYTSIGISLFFVLLFIVLAGYYVYLSHDLKKNLKIKENYLKKIREQKPLVTEDLIKNLLKKIEAENIKVKNSLEIYKPIAILKDLSNMTPNKIKWNSFELKENKKISIDALIEKSSTSKMEMADYLLRLKYSPFVKDASIIKQDIRYIDKKPYDFISVEILLN